MVINSKLKEEIKSYLIDEITNKIENYDFSKKSGNPFIDIIFGKHSNIKTFVHSTATMLGSKYEIIARKIVESNPNFIKAEKLVLQGSISDSEKSVIKDIVKDLEESNENSNYDLEIKKIFNAGSKNIKPTRITIDLYLKTKNGKEFFIEMKGPDPNKKEVRAAKEDLLNVIAIKKRHMELDNFNDSVGIVFGVYYNNNDGKYNNWKVSPLFEEGKGLIVGKDFWDFLGGNGTYDDLIEIIKDCKKVLSPIIDRKINDV